MSRNSLNVMPGAVVCEESKLRGDITIGKDTIVHPCAIIIAEAGPIVIGERCLLEEQSKIIYRLPFDKEKESAGVLTIGSDNVFEVDCTVEAAEIGNNNVFESKCFVGNKVTVSNGCTIGAGCRITEEQVLKDNLIIFGEKCRLREGIDKPMSQHSQMDTLMKILPNYHHIRRANKKM